ncbi:MAG: peptidoglycan DD-metalloendopeptidase family protein [Chitinivibrionales bacterium]|nr:peptidoglycan DD-metalloendopeptidase family protein [Chitinivibrionales bacterium]
MADAAIGQKSSAIQQFEERLQVQNGALDSIKKELNKGRKRIKELSKKEGVFLEQLEALEINIDASVSFLGGLNGKIDTVSQHIQLLTDSLAILGRQLQYRQQKMRMRLKNIYTLGSPHLLEIVLTSGTITDVLNRVKYFQQLHRYDQSLLVSIDNVRNLVSENMEIRRREYRELTDLRTVKEQEIAHLQSQQENRQKLLQEVQAEKKSFQAMVKELQRAQAELTSLVKNLEVKRRKAKKEYEQNLKTDFVRRKGSLSWPVEGQVIRGFGKVVHPVYQTVTNSSGIDIKASKGTSVHSVAPGAVEYIGWMRGYGKFIIINHFGDYSTIYAHLDKVLVTENQSVKSNEDIAEVGETGSLNGPKLHFQIRKSSETLDPVQWLEKKK